MGSKTSVVTYFFVPFSIWVNFLVIFSGLLNPNSAVSSDWSTSGMAEQGRGHAHLDLSNHLTQSQPGGGADFAHQITTRPPDFQTFRHPWPFLWGICPIPIYNEVKIFLKEHYSNFDSLVHSQNYEICIS